MCVHTHVCHDAAPSTQVGLVQFHILELELGLNESNFFHTESGLFPADDGKLSLEEFQAFFSDGTLNEEELEKLFHIIDSDNTRSESPQH